MIAERIRLTDREQEIVALKMQGLSSKEIAYRLSLSHSAVRNYSSHLLRRYQCKNTTELCCKILGYREE